MLCDRDFEPAVCVRVCLRLRSGGWPRQQVPSRRSSAARSRSCESWWNSAVLTPSHGYSNSTAECSNSVVGSIPHPPKVRTPSSLYTQSPTGVADCCYKHPSRRARTELNRTGVTSSFYLPPGRVFDNVRRISIEPDPEILRFCTNFINK